MTYLLVTRKIYLTDGPRAFSAVLKVGRRMPIFISSDPGKALAVYRTLKGGM